jgi:hypothetical protein
VLASLLAAALSAQAASVRVKNPPPPDPFCVPAAKREEQKKKLADKISQADCSHALRKLRLARLDCSEPQTIRDFKSAMLGAVSPDDAYAEGFARALCPGKADAACMNPEPQCRARAARREPKLSRVAERDKNDAALRKFYEDRLPDVDERQAQVMVDHYWELHGQH